MIFMNKHLLVVDDNSVNIELLLDLLDDHGFDNVHGLSDRVTYLPTVSSSCPI